MNFNSEILFFFSALGAFNGVALSAYILFTAGKKHIANIFLAMALLMLSIRAGKSVFFYFDDNLAQSFVQIGLIACFFIGPFLYFFVATVCDRQHIPPKWHYHLWILTPVILILTVLFPYYEHHHLWSHYLLRCIYLVWLAYLILSIRAYYRAHKSDTVHKGKNAMMQWTLHVIVSFSLVWLAYFTTQYTSYIVGAITFTVIGHLLILFILNTKKKNIFLLNSPNEKVDPGKTQVLMDQLEKLFQTQDIYKQPALKCADVAKLMEVPSYQLSQAINTASGMNFTSFINQYRIEAAKKMLRSRPELTAEAIGQECGFKSKSSFYAAFKKITGTTPSKFV